MVFSVNSVAQVAISEYLDVVDVNQLHEFYQQKRDLFSGLLTESRLKILPSEGTFFILASYEEVSTETDVDFAKILVRDFGVAAIPLSVFYENPGKLRLIRFCFAKENETLIAAASKLLML